MGVSNCHVGGICEWSEKWWVLLSEWNSKSKWKYLTSSHTFCPLSWSLSKLNIKLLSFIIIVLLYETQDISNNYPLQHVRFVQTLRVKFIFSLLEDDIQPCAKIQMSRSTVPLGSSVTATCVIRDDCPLVVGQAVHIEWRLGDHFLPSSPVATKSSRVSEVVIPSFNYTRAFLTCCVRASPIQIVGGVEIRAGCERDLNSVICLLINIQITMSLFLLHQWKLFDHIWREISHILTYI